jgi:hypothetical protein
MYKPNFSYFGLTMLFDKVSSWYHRFYLEKELSSAPCGDDYEYAWLVSLIGDSAGEPIYYYF